MGSRTGGFKLGFRRVGRGWMQDDLKKTAEWAKAAGFDVIDIPRGTPEDLKTVQAAGLGIGTVDLVDWPPLLSDDAGKRKEAIAKNVELMKACVAQGVKRFFCCIIPEHAEKPRLENHKLAVQSYGELAREAEKLGAMIVLEGWPGGGSLPNLACNPESYRAIFKDTGTRPGGGLGVNYDPSHLIRMGIDHIRFLNEFAPFVGHVHGKDTEVDSEAVYEYGLYQGSIFAASHRFGAHIWRYTIPGHGLTRWRKVFDLLAAAKVSPAVCVELEDENYNGSEAGEKAALELSLEFFKRT